MPDQFRTRTGQTGIEAYINEATAIANAQRELDARMTQLADAIIAECEPGQLLHNDAVTDSLTLEMDLYGPIARAGFYRRGSEARELHDRLACVLRGTTYTGRQR